jgi:hypothetical protein
LVSPKAEDEDHWKCSGTATALAACGILDLDVKAFFNVVANDNVFPYLCKYAKQFAKLSTAARRCDKYHCIDTWGSHGEDFMLRSVSFEKASDLGIRIDWQTKCVTFVKNKESEVEVGWRVHAIEGLPFCSLAGLRGKGHDPCTIRFKVPIYDLRQLAAQEKLDEHIAAQQRLIHLKEGGTSQNGHDETVEMWADSMLVAHNDANGHDETVEMGADSMLVAHNYAGLWKNPNTDEVHEMFLTLKPKSKGKMVLNPWRLTETGRATSSMHHHSSRTLTKSLSQKRSGGHHWLQRMLKSRPEDDCDAFTIKWEQTGSRVSITKEKLHFIGTFDDRLHICGHVLNDETSPAEAGWFRVRGITGVNDIVHTVFPPVAGKEDDEGGADFQMVHSASKFLRQSKDALGIGM